MDMFMRLGNDCERGWGSGVRFWNRCFSRGEKKIENV